MDVDCGGRKSAAKTMRSEHERSPDHYGSNNDDFLS
jgi:hypothetical protein